MQEVDRFAPTKINLNKIHENLSKKQLKRIAYECNLMFPKLSLQEAIQKLIFIAPHIFNEGVFSTNSVKTAEPELEEEPKLPSTEQFMEYEDISYYYPA